MTQLILHGTAIVCKLGVAPGDDRSIAQDCSECPIGRLDLLHISQLILYCTAVATKVITPGDDRSISQNCSECARSSLDLLHFAQLVLYRTAVATIEGIAPGDHRSISQNCSECTR